MTEFVWKSGCLYAPDKDPNDILPYTFNWGTWLSSSGIAWAAGDDTITVSEWTVPLGITKADESNTATTATIKLSGGTAGQTYSILNRITTADGNSKDRTFKIYIKEQ